MAITYRDEKGAPLSNAEVDGNFRHLDENKADAILDMPKVRPSLNLDFVNSKIVDSRIDFTRSTTASYYDGKTTVKAEENLILSSSTSANNYYNSVAIEENSTVAPDGSSTALKTTLNDEVGYSSKLNGIPNANVEYVFSGFAKKGLGSEWVFGATIQGIGGYEFTYNFDTQAITNVVNGSNPTMEDVGNGWFRLSFRFTPTGLGTSSNIFRIAKGIVGTSSVGDYVYTWGTQLEQRDTLTAYTPTAGTPITNYIPVLQTADINKPRLDHDPITGECKGLLMEEARTNLNEYSEDVLNGSTYDSQISYDTDVIIAPDGNLTADKVIPIGDNGRAGRHFTMYGTMVEGATYTLSGFYKADGSHYTRVKLGGVFGSENAIFDFDTGEFVQESANVLNTKAENVGDGWWRLSVSYVFQNAINNNAPYALIAQPLLSNNSAVAPSYTGYNGVYVWGVQYEKAAFATSYIPTDGATVTRSIDSAVVTGVNLSDAFNNSEFSMYAEMQRTGSNSTSQEFAGIELSSDTFQGNVLSLAYDSGSFDRANARLFNANKGMTVLLSAAGSTPNFEDGEEITKFAFGLKQGDSRLYAQGLSNPSASTSLTTTPFTPEYLRIQPDNIRDTFSNFCGYCRKVSLYPKRLPDTELQALTQE